ncbi:MAG: peptidoglycan editing factor PgeF [Comamonadaceae bacterium]|nr:MAG: peptidoglycan editing factor PgeF [Comamonadaceae bacterium]
MVPDWPVPANVRAVFTARAGGVSVPPWDSFNLGDHVGDTPADVLENRQRLQQMIGAKAVFLQQVHGVDVLQLASGTPDGSRADACVTTEYGLACTIMVADCLPVLLATRDGNAVAAAHAGWRGLAGPGLSAGVLESVHAALLAAGAEPSGIIAWLGPCIGPTAFEVGAEVKAAFESSQPESADCFKPQDHPQAGKYLADLAALARLRLKALGVNTVYGNDGTDAWCTVRNPSRFFAHRREAGSVTNGGNGFGTTGRMAACIWLS